MFRFLFCVTCFLTSGKLRLGGGRVLLPVFLLSSKHWVNVGLSQTHTWSMYSKTALKAVPSMDFQCLFMLGTASRSPHECTHTFLLTAWHVSDITFDLITKILIDGQVYVSWSSRPWLVHTIKQCWQVLPEHHMVHEGKSCLHFNSAGWNWYKLVWHHCYLSNQYQVGFSLLNKKKSLVFEIIQSVFCPYL